MMIERKGFAVIPADDRPARSIRNHLWRVVVVVDEDIAGSEVDLTVPGDSLVRRNPGGPNIRTMMPGGDDSSRSVCNRHRMSIVPGTRIDDHTVGGFPE